ncbi:MAG: DASS family sodium-coupled anion symporter [Deltaproteobacteria bacterium]|nr:DASS family sodium-coupled anion symporter [Deltaproteobacteria bacterium]
MEEEFKAEEAVSEAEKRFELYRRTVSLFLGPAVFLILFLTPMPPLTAQSHSLAAVLGLVLIYWIGEPVPIPVTAVLGPVLCVMLGVAKSSVVFAPFAHPIIFLFIGSFMLAEAMKAHRLDYRISLGILSLPWVGGSYLGVFIAIAAIPAAMSMWISDSATTAMIYPITVGIAGAVSRLSSGATSRFSTGLLLTIAYAALIGGIGTPVGTPPNLIGIGMIDKLAGVRIDFFQWMLMAVPIMIAMFIAMLVYMFAAHRPPGKEVSGLSAFINEKRSELGGWTRGQKNTLAAFSIAAILWVTPGVALSLFGETSGIHGFLDAYLREEIVSLIAAMILFFTPVDWKERRFTLSWAEAVRIDWGTILLFGGGLSLGGLMFSTGLADAIGTALIQATGVNTLWGITAMATGLAIVATEVTSNTATANMLVPLMISIAKTAGTSPVPPAIGVCLGASMAFMLPVSTPSNAIVYGSGRVPITSMIRAGAALDVVSFFVIMAGLRIMCPLLGLA